MAEDLALGVSVFVAGFSVFCRSRSEAHRLRLASYLAIVPLALDLFPVHQGSGSPNPLLDGSHLSIHRALEKLD